MAKIVGIVVQKASFLHEIAEHKPVQHDAGIPLFIQRAVDALDKLQKVVMLPLESIIEFLCDFFGIDRKIRVDAIGNVENGNVIFFVEVENKPCGALV